MTRYALHALVLLLPAVVACGSTPTPGASDVTTTYDRQFNFSGAHKVFIQPTSRTDPATIAVSDAQINRIDDALGSELTRKGFEMVGSSRQADLLLNWYLIPRDPVADKADASDCGGCDMVVVGGARYARGTLVVDVIDPMRNMPVWRSVLKTELTADPGSPRAAQARNAAAAAVFADFPPQ